MKPIYLDYAAATPLAKEVRAAMAAHETDFFNPSAIYLKAQEAADAIEAARRTAGVCLGAKPAEIIFTAGATEADNLAIGGVLQAHPRSRVAVAATEHKAVLNSASGFSGGKADIIPVDRRGLVRPTALKAAIKPSTVLVSIALADSELGAVQPLRRLLPVIEAERARRARAGDERPLYLHSDAAQAANYLDLHVNRLGADLLSLGGGKIYGPKSAGLLYVRRKVRIDPVLYGGGQERNLRSGTQNLAAIAGLAAALQLAQDDRAAEARRIRKLKDRLKQGLAGVRGLQFNGDDSQQLPNIINLSLPGADGERLVMKLDQAGIMAATGAACSLLSDQPSHVLQAIGLSDEHIGGSLRFSLGRPTTEAEIDRATRIIRRVMSGLNRSLQRSA